MRTMDEAAVVADRIPIPRDDGMFDADRSRYLGVGREAATLVAHAVGDAPVRGILDYPSGHGRVARYLTALWPDAELSVADLDAAGVAFCQDALGAVARVASTDFDALDYGTTFDVIWAGSLATHLPPSGVRAFLRFVTRHLTAGGVAVVTSHGDLAAGRMKYATARGKAVYGNKPGRNRACLNDYFRRGYGFVPYQDQDAYGTSLIDERTWSGLAREAALDVTSFRPRAWDEHQDVLSLRHAS